MTTASAEHAQFRKTGALEDAKKVRSHRRAVFGSRVTWAEPHRLLDTVWRTPGAMHPKLPLGRLEVGCRANLVVWDTAHPAFWPLLEHSPGGELNALLRALTTSDVTHAIWGMQANGRWVAEPGAHAASLRAAEGYVSALHEASGRLANLLKRAGV